MAPIDDVLPRRGEPITSSTTWSAIRDETYMCPIRAVI